MNPPYALLICHNLRCVRFDLEEDMLTAIAALRRQEKLFVALKWNAGAATYVPQEILD